MNIYLLPIYDADDASLEILKFKAKDLSSAEDKVIDYFRNKYEVDESIFDWESLENYAADELNIVIGDLYDIVEFEDRVGY